MIDEYISIKLLIPAFDLISYAIELLESVAESVISYLEPINEKFNNLGDKEVDEIIRKNLELAKQSAELTISEVEEALGIS